MKKNLNRWLQDVWYKDPFIGTWLMPFGFLFSDFAKFRKFLYRIGVLKTSKLPVPVIIVGNISVGGTGKTPLVIYLAKFLENSGFKPGIISRGYGGSGKDLPQTVNIASTASQVGDEALLIARRSHCPMAVCSIRAEAAKLLLDQYNCNVILSDDGLQHYALKRDIEIAVVDGERRFGNGYCLPAGPLREPIERLQTVDLVVFNGKQDTELMGLGVSREFIMQLEGETAVNLLTGKQKPLQEFVGIDCYALAGIGNPTRFFNMLESFGLNCNTMSFPDHYVFQSRDITFSDNKPVLMTEKDAVKCTGFATDNHWFVPVTANLAPEFTAQLLTLLKRIP